MNSQTHAPRGLLILGGQGTRLFPLTHNLNKHFLPVYDKPMFHYPLSSLLLAGCRHISVVSKGTDLGRFQEAIEVLRLPGVTFEFFEQISPLGIVDAIEVAKNSLEGKNFWLALGDNLLFGPGLGRNLLSIHADNKCHVFSTVSNEPQRFGSIRVDSRGRPLEIREKAPKDFSNQVLTGLYLFPAHTFELISSIKTSQRGEREITDLLATFMHQNELTLRQLPLGTTWIDLGTFNDLQDAGTMVRLHQFHTGEKVGDPVTSHAASESSLEMLGLDN